ncbi:MAG: ABC transporter ATP-binding protein [Bacteroidales bacterium]|nr:ABC transporter ATP-binding protein [Bacteroidales bacterium]
MINVEDLKYSYPGSSKEALHGISFQIGTGEIFGFLGPSGAGKSTTQKVLNGLLKGYNGIVQVNNIEIAKITPRFYNDIGVVFEFPNLYNKLTALENLKVYASFYEKKTSNLEGLLEKVGLIEDRNTQVEAFSKGMKMRLNFVRALINNPRVLFLDEPTSGLDPVNARRMKDIIIDLKNQGTTIFLTTHNMTDADELCDRLAFIVDGKLVLTDSPTELKLRYGKKEVQIVAVDNEQEEIYQFPMQHLGENKDFFDVLKSREIRTIHTQEASLEDIFIQVTGQKLNTR